MQKEQIKIMENKLNQLISKKLSNSNFTTLLNDDDYKYINLMLDTLAKSKEINENIPNQEFCYKNFDVDIKHSTIACSGVLGAYSHIVSKNITDSEIIFTRSFEEVFEQVSDNDILGVVPIENSTAGYVGENLQLFEKFDCKIIGEYYLPIFHTLVAKKKIEFMDVKRVISHPQALLQCAKFIKTKLPNAKITEGINTAASAKYVSECAEENICAISSTDCAELYNLTILQNNIQDYGLNTTRFLLLAKNMKFDSKSNKISVSFVLQHKKNALAILLDHCKIFNINLVKIHSETIPDSNFNVRFFLDFEGNVTESNAINFLNCIKFYCIELKFLGNYSKLN